MNLVTEAVAEPVDKVLAVACLVDYITGNPVELPTLWIPAVHDCILQELERRIPAVHDRAEHLDLLPIRRASQLGYPRDICGNGRLTRRQRPLLASPEVD